MIIELGTVIAERYLDVIGSPGLEVRVKLGAPQPFPDGQDYYCPYQITGIGREKVKSMS